MAGSIRQEELLGRRRIAPDMEKDAADAIGCMDHRLIDGAGLGRMLERQFKRIIDKLVETIAPRASNPLIADIDPCAEAGKVDIDPIGILRYAVEEAAVFEDIGIDRIVEAIGVAGAIEGLVLMPGEIDTKIAARFWRVGAVAGLEGCEEYQDDIRKCACTQGI